MAERQPHDQEGPASRDASRASGRGEDTSSWYRLAGIGFEFIAAVGLFGGIGWWLDRTFNTAPWLMIAGFGLGFATGLFLMVRAANQVFRK